MNARLDLPVSPSLEYIDDLVLSEGAVKNLHLIDKTIEKEAPIVLATGRVFGIAPMPKFQSCAGVKIDRSRVRFHENTVQIKREIISCPGNSKKYQVFGNIVLGGVSTSTASSPAKTTELSSRLVKVHPSVRSPPNF